MDKITEQYYKVKIDEIKEKLEEKRQLDEEKELLQEMATIAIVGNYELSVYNKEGPTPHFHFKNLKTEDEGCLKILQCEYFKHGKYKAELNSAERKVIYNFLQAVTTEEIYKQGTTNFEIICHEWNKNNSQYKIPLNTPLPNYRSLKKKGTKH